MQETYGFYLFKKTIIKYATILPMNSTKKLQELFLKFPGIGPKQAARFVYFLLRENADYKNELAQNIEYLKNTAHVCKQCLRIFGETNYYQQKDICEICHDDNRDGKSLMILIKELDIDAVERTNLYHGKYFVLGSTLPFLNSQKPSAILNIRELVKLISENLNSQNLNSKNITKDTTKNTIKNVGEKENINSTEKISEIIFAIPASDEGEHTIDYLKKTLAQIVGIQKIKMSTLARGLSTGLDLEYVDKNTFNQAFQHRE